VALPTKISALTLFVDDIAAARSFYAGVFGLPVHFEDEESVVLLFGDTMVNLLAASAAPELVAPAPVGQAGDASRSVFTLTVDDVDAVCDELRAKGVELLNGPIDRPWGVRTASFRDPDGHIWEIAH
jgi:lactoylglutathione lyase